MPTREQLQAAYELAFHPPRLDRLWRRVKNGKVQDKEQVIELLEMAMTLHLMLPRQGYSSMRALKRLAYYQACSRAFGTFGYLRNVYTHLCGTEPNLPGEVPGEWVRDFALPPFCHHQPER